MSSPRRGELYRYRQFAQMTSAGDGRREDSEGTRLWHSSRVSSSRSNGRSLDSGLSILGLVALLLALPMPTTTCCGV
jgi:hypothetical protein